jgi:hypothetical protein
LRLSQLLFILVALVQLDEPFLSAHNERQNQTYDMSRHIFREGWGSVIVPRVTYSLPGHGDRKINAVVQEVPFHGVLGWPIARLTGHDRAAVRLVSAAFGVFSIQVVFGILRAWLPSLTAAVGAALWGTAPLVLQFGQVPMPDILCTTGMLASFACALRARLGASAGWFMFALLAKVSMIVFGLPILTALLIVRNCRSWSQILRVSLLWGWLPTAGLAICALIIHLFSPPTGMSVSNILAETGDWHRLIHASFYKLVLGCLLPFGLGVLGSWGLVLSVLPAGPGMDWRIKWAIVAANVIFLLGVVRKVTEPQYLLPMLAWFVIAAAFGLNRLAAKLQSGLLWRSCLAAAVVIHLLVAAFFCVDLKSSRVPNYPDIIKAGEFLPADARVIAFYRFYGASPAAWLDRNMIPLSSVEALDGQLEQLKQWGFNYVLILDIESVHNKGSDTSFKAMYARIIRMLQGKPSDNPINLPGFADPAGPARRYCDSRFSLLYAAPHVALYSIMPARNP